MLQTGFNIFNVMVGCSILGMPFALRLSGYVELVTIICICIFTGITAFFIDDILDYKQNNNPGMPAIRGYSEMIYSVLGARAATITVMFVCVEFYLYVVLNAIFAGQTLYGILPDSWTDDEYSIELFSVFNFKFTAQSCIVLVMIIVAPTCYLRDLKPLSYLSSFGVIAMFTIVLALFKLFVESSPLMYDTRAKDQKMFESANGIFYCFGMAIATYSAHAAFPNMRASMKDPTKFKTVVWITYCITMVFLISVAFMGYYTFGGESRPLIQLNFPNSDIVSLIANIMLIVKTWSTVALLLLPVSNALENIIKIDYFDEKNLNGMINSARQYSKMFLIRTVLLVVATIIAYVLPDFVFMSNLIGAACALSMTILIPSAAYIKLFKDEFHKDKLMLLQSKAAQLKYYVAFVLFTCGIFIGISNLYELGYYGATGPVPR